jgi:uncharacterized membrane-anchored protein YitT (DUF2179 family)
MEMDIKRFLIRRLPFIFLGTFISAVTVNALLIPHKLLSGGITGLGIILFYLFSLPISITVFVLNIPLFILGYKYISPRFMYLSIIGMAAFSVFLELTKGIVLPVGNPIIAAVFGGLATGVGAGIVLKNRASMGGADIISVLFNKYFSLDIGWVNMAVNAIVLALGAVVISIELALLTMISMFVASKAIDAIQEGFNHGKMVIIVSNKSEQLAHEIMTKLNRGVTFIKGEGAYIKGEKQLIYCIVKTLELARLKDIVHAIDKGAFMSVSDTKEVMGTGFTVTDRF